MDRAKCGPWSPAGLEMRHEMRPGDIAQIIRLHAVIYAAEEGYDVSFEAYVARTFGERSWPLTDRERVWIVERSGAVAGSMAIVKASDVQAQLRWLLLERDLRGLGLGRRMVSEGIAFARAAGYTSLFLWTEDALEAAAALYGSLGFLRTEAITHEAWGGRRTEVRYELGLPGPPRSPGGEE